MSNSDRRDYRSLGEILSDAREEHGWSVEELSERTKIAPKQLHALEADDLASLSGPVYARGFVRNLCALYHLDQEWLNLKLDAALESNEESVEPAAQIVDAPQVTGSESGLAEDSESEDDAPEGPTWTIETVDNARVHRVHSEAGSSPWPRVLGGVILLAIALLSWWWIAGRSDTRPPAEEGTALELTTPVEQPTVDPVVLDDETTRVSEERADTDPAQQDEAQGEVEPITVQSAGTDLGDAERVLYDDSQDEGLGSVLRQSDELREEFELHLSAIGPVVARVSVDGEDPQNRRMRAGQSWTLRARDHFTLQLSDVSNVIAEIDGVRRLPPRGDFPEWILYRKTATADAD